MKATNMSVAGINPPVSSGMSVEAAVLWPCPINNRLVLKLRELNFDFFQIVRILRKAGLKQFNLKYPEKEVTEFEAETHTYGPAGTVTVRKDVNLIEHCRINRNGVKIVRSRRAKPNAVRQRAMRWLALVAERQAEVIKTNRMAFVNEHKNMNREIRVRVVWTTQGQRRPIGAHAPRRLQVLKVVGYNALPDIWDAPPGILQEAWDKIVKQRMGLIKPARPVLNPDGTQAKDASGKPLFYGRGDGVRVWQPAKPGPVEHLRWSGSFAVMPDGQLIADAQEPPEGAIVVSARDMNRAAWFWARRLFKHHMAALNRYDRTRNVADVADLIVGLSTTPTKKGGGAWLAETRPDGSFGVHPSGWIEDSRNGRELRPEDRGFILAIRLMHPNMSMARSIVTEGRTLAKHLADARVKLVAHNDDGTVKLDDNGRTVYNMVRVLDLPHDHPKVAEWFRRFETRKKKAAKGWAGRYEAAPLGSLNTTLETDPKMFRSTARDTDPSRAMERKEMEALMSLSKVDPTGLDAEDWSWFRRIYLSNKMIGNRSNVLRMRRIANQLGIKVPASLMT